MSKQKRNTQPPVGDGVPHQLSEQTDGRDSTTSMSWTTWLFCVLCLAIATIAAYSNSYEGIAIFDDDPFIRNSQDIIKPTPPSLFRPAITRPFVCLTLWCNYQISGFQLWSYHWTNLLGHLISVIALFEISRRLVLISLPATTSRQPTWKWLFPLAVALVWGVHPLNTQAVTYVIQRCESMMGMFFLLSLLCLIQSVQNSRNSSAWLIAGLISAWLGMGCKQVIATVAGVAFLLDYVFLEPSINKILRRRWWFYLGLIGIGIYGLYDAISPLITPSTQKLALSTELGTKSVLKDPTISAGFHFDGFTKWEYLRTQFEIIPFYLRLAVWPDPLCLDYRWLVQSNPLIYLSYAALLTSLFLAGVWLTWKRHPVGFLILSFFFILAPTSSIMPINDMALEHRMYLPLIYVVATGVTGLYRLLQVSTPTKTVAAFTAIIVAWSSVLGYLTYQRNFDYYDEISLWQSVVKAAPNNDRAWRNLGHYYNVYKKPDQSLEAFQHALDLLSRIDPTPPDSEFAEVHRNIGNAHKDLGQFEAAMASFQSSMKFNPNDSITHESLGRLYAIRGQMDAASVHFYKAQSISPNDGDIQHDLGAFNVAIGKYDEAIKHFERACQLEPMRLDFGQTLAGTYANLGQFEQAVKAYDALLARLPPATYERPQIEAYRAKAYQALLQQRAQKQTQPR